MTRKLGILPFQSELDAGSKHLMFNVDFFKIGRPARGDGEQTLHNVLVRGVLSTVDQTGSGRVLRNLDACHLGVYDSTSS